MAPASPMADSREFRLGKRRPRSPRGRSCPYRCNLVFPDEHVMSCSSSAAAQPVRLASPCEMTRKQTLETNGDGETVSRLSAAGDGVPGSLVAGRLRLLRPDYVWLFKAPFLMPNSQRAKSLRERTGGMGNARLQTSFLGRRQHEGSHERFTRTDILGSISPHCLV